MPTNRLSRDRYERIADELDKLRWPPSDSDWGPSDSLEPLAGTPPLRDVLAMDPVVIHDLPSDGLLVAGMVIVAVAFAAGAFCGAMAVVICR